MIIGIVGTICSGKSVFSEMLQKADFTRLSFSDEVREEVRKRNIPIERKLLQDIGNEMREKYGADYWAKRVISKMQKGKNYVVEGIRNPGEIEALRKLNGFVLMGVDAPIEKRIDWIKKREKDSDPKTEKEIMMIDARDRGIGEASSGQQTEACFRMADIVMMNNSSLEELKRKADVLMRAFSKAYD